ncbi:MAG: hypothetical protein ACOH2H_18230 [Cypionkella sp.]
MPRNRLRTGLVTLALLGLLGCDETMMGTGLHETKVLGGTLTIAAPQGYCIDPKASVTRGKSVVALIGRCTARGEVAPAVVSVTIGAPASAGVLVAGPEVLAKFFASTPGRTLLARDGVASHVVVMNTMVSKGTLLVHVKDKTAGEYWRAILALRGRLVTVSASGTEGAPLTSAQGLKLVRDVVSILNSRNPDKAPLAQKL